MQSLLAYLKKFEQLSPEAEIALKEICSEISISKIKTCNPLAIPAEQFILSIRE